MPAFVRLVPAVALAFLCAAPPAAAQPSPPQDAEKVEIIRQLLEITRAADQMILAIETSLPAQRASNPRIPAVFWDRFLEHARARRGELLESIIPLYSRTFATNELRTMLEFYQTPVGRRLLEVQPALLRDTSQLGQAWGSRIGIEIAQQLSAEGVQLQP